MKIMKWTTEHDGPGPYWFRMTPESKKDIAWVTQGGELYAYGVHWPLNYFKNAQFCRIPEPED